MPFSIALQINNNQVWQDVSPILWKARQNHALLSILRLDTQRPSGDVERKFQWPERFATELLGELRASYSVLTPTVMEVVSTTPFRVGDVIHLNNHQNATFQKIRFSVTAITDSDTLAVALLGSGNANYTLGTTGNNEIHITRGQPDNQSKGTGTVTEPTMVTQYIQTFQQDLELGRMAQVISKSGLQWGFMQDDAIIQGLVEHAEMMAHEIDNAVWNGFGRAYTSATSPAMMKGIDQFINQGTSGQQVNGGGGSLDEAMINELIKKLVIQGLPDNGELLFVTNPDTAMLISAIRAVNTTYTDTQPNMEFGGGVRVYHSRLGNHPIRIIANPKFDGENITYVLNPSDITLVAPISQIPAGSSPMSFDPVDGVPPGLAWIVESTTPGQDGNSWTMRAELSLKVKGALKRHGTIVNYTNTSPS